MKPHYDKYGKVLYKDNYHCPIVFFGHMAPKCQVEAGHPSSPGAHKFLLRRVRVFSFSPRPLGDGRVRAFLMGVHEHERI